MDKQSIQRESTPELVADLLRQSGELVKIELALAKAELREDVKSEVRSFAGFGVAALCGIAVLNLLLATAVLALATVVAAWAAALIVAAIVLVIGGVAGFVGYKMRVQRPLEKTQRTIQEDVRWTKRKLS